VSLEKPGQPGRLLSVRRKTSMETGSHWTENRDCLVSQDTMGTGFGDFCKTFVLSNNPCERRRLHDISSWCAVDSNRNCLPVLMSPERAKQFWWVKTSVRYSAESEF